MGRKRGLDLDRLAALLKERMEVDGVSIRSAARDAGCSAATLGRLLRGSKSKIVPDSSTLIRASAYVGKGLSDLEVERDASAKIKRSFAEVEPYLRKLAHLTPKDAERLIGIVKAAYFQLRSGGK